MPRRSPESGLRVLGWMKTKLFELWMGPNTAPKTAAGAGGKIMRQNSDMMTTPDDLRSILYVQRTVMFKF